MQVEKIWKNQCLTRDNMYHAMCVAAGSNESRAGTQVVIDDVSQTPASQGRRADQHRTTSPLSVA